MTCAEEKMWKGAQKVKEKRNPEKLLSYTLRRAMPKYENCVFIKDISKCKKHFYASKKNNMLARQKKSTNKVRAGRWKLLRTKEKEKTIQDVQKKYPNSLSIYSSFAISTI